MAEYVSAITARASPGAPLRAENRVGLREPVAGAARRETGVRRRLDGLWTARVRRRGAGGLNTAELNTAELNTAALNTAELNDDSPGKISPGLWCALGER